MPSPTCSPRSMAPPSPCASLPLQFPKCRATSIMSRMPEIGTVSGARLQGGDGWARVLAGLIALAAWAGIAIHFHALASGAASWAGALWALIGYFTITTNLLVAIVFTGVTL